MEAPLKMIAALVTEAAVSGRLLEERKGVEGIRRRAYEELLDHEFSMLCSSAPGQLQLAWIRLQMDPGYRASGNIRKWLELLMTAEKIQDTGELIRLTDLLYNQMMEPDFERKRGTLEQVLAVTIEELREFSWKDFLSEELYEDALETYLEKLSLDLTSLPEVPEQTAEEGSEEEQKKKKKKIVVVDEETLTKTHSYVELNYGKTWLTPAQEKQRNEKLCRGLHGDCSLYYTEGILKHPVKKNYQLAYASKQKDKNIHAYYDAHREVKQNIRLLTGALKKSPGSAGGHPVFSGRLRKDRAVLAVEGGTVSPWKPVFERTETGCDGLCGGRAHRCQRISEEPAGAGGNAGIYSQ